MVGDKFPNPYVPFETTLELTYQCTFRCTHCYVDYNTRPPMKIHMYKNLLKEISDLGGMKVSLTGGEVFTDKKRLLDVATLCKYYGFYTTILTNASLVDENLAKELGILGIDDFRISLYGATDKTYRNVTRTFNDVDRILNNVLLLKKYNKHIQMQTVVLNNNICDLEDMNNWCHQEGIRYEVDTLVMAKNSLDKRNLLYALADRQVIHVNKEYRSHHSNKIIEEKGVNIHEERHKVYERSMCSAAWHKLCITPYGIVYPCVNWREEIGNLNDNSFIQVWVERISESLMNIRNLHISDFVQCSNCKYIKYCPLCPGRNYAYTGSCLKPDLEICKYVKLIKHEIVEKVN